MKDLKGKAETPTAVEKAGGAFRLKADPRPAEDLAALKKGDLKVDELAAVVGRLMERVSALEEG